MITALLIFLPLLFAALLLLIRSDKSKYLALTFALAQLGLAITALVSFDKTAETQFEINIDWIKQLGIHFHVGMDGISLLLVLLTCVLYPLIILSSFKNKRSASFYALMFIMQTGLLGVFTALDGFLFYVFWEVALIPVYFICLLWGGVNRVKITFRFFIYTLFGSLLMLAALIYIYLMTPGQHSFELADLYHVQLDRMTQGLLFWAIFIAFAIKMPIFPFHSWQPDTYTDAPQEGTMLLSGIMLKMGIYGLIRILIPMTPLGLEDWGTTALVLSLIGIVYASLLAWVQNDFKRLIAYSSIAHIGLIAAGIFSLNTQAWQGSAMQMISHGIYATGLFFVASLFESRTGTRNMNELGGIRLQSPRFNTLFLIILLGSIGLPLTSGFIGEFLLLGGLFQRQAWMAGVAGLSMIFGAVYMLGAFQKTMLGEQRSTVLFQELDTTETITLTIIAGLIILLGVYPQPILDIAGPSMEKILAIIHHTSASAH